MFFSFAFKIITMKNFLLLLSIVFFSINQISAQIDSDYKYEKELTVDKKYIFEFRDGTIIIGKFIEESDGNIWITDEKGKKIYLPQVMVAQVHDANNKNIIDGEYWFPNLHETRYFFSPSAFGLNKGEGYYSHSYWLLWQVQFGITNNFSIGGGTTPFGIPATLNAKFNMGTLNKSNFAVGYFWVGNLFWDLDGDNTVISMPYSVLTIGTKEKNFSIATGLNLDDFSGSTKLQERFVINSGGIVRTSRRFALLYEFWLLDMFSKDRSFLFGPGVRYFRKVNRVTSKNGAGASTWDFQFLHFSENDDALVIPMFGASRKF